jgi:hypothetical protein
MFENQINLTFIIFCFTEKLSHFFVKKSKAIAKDKA